MKEIEPGAVSELAPAAASSPPGCRAAQTGSGVESAVFCVRVPSRALGAHPRTSSGLGDRVCSPISVSERFPGCKS